MFQNIIHTFTSIELI